MTIEPKLMSAEELAELIRSEHDEPQWWPPCVPNLLAHIAAQERLLRDTEDTIDVVRKASIERGQRADDLELRLSIATELNVVDRREVDRLRTALTDAVAYWRYPCLSAREKERKDEILAMLDE